MGALGTAYSPETVGEDAALEKGLELVFDKRRQARPGLRLDLREEGLELFPHHLIQGRFFRAPPLGSDLRPDRSFTRHYCGFLRRQMHLAYFPAAGC
jgi:hypothetical protein